MGTKETHTKQMEKSWELNFSAALSSTQQHTQQHSAVLNLQLISRFPDFLHSGVKKVRAKPKKKSQNPSPKMEKQ